MSSRDTYNSTVTTSGKTQTAAVVAAVGVAQTTIDAALSVVGYTLQTGNYTNLAAAVKAANAARVAALNAAEQAKQAAINVAKDTLRATGDVAPA